MRLKSKPYKLAVGVVAALCLLGAPDAFAVQDHNLDFRGQNSDHFREATRSNNKGKDLGALLAQGDFIVPPSQRHHQAQSGGGRVSSSVVIRNIRSRYPGKSLDIRSVGNKYKVIWLTPDGRRLDIMADARTGDILSVRGD